MTEPTREELIKSVDDMIESWVAGGFSNWKEVTLFRALRERLEREQNGINERVAQLTAHRACCGTEHDPSQGKLHGCCVVCGVPWPCTYAGEPAR